MELGNLLNALIQGAETNALTNVGPRENPAPASPAGLQPGTSIPLEQGSGVSVQANGAVSVQLAPGVSVQIASGSSPGLVAQGAPPAVAAQPGTSVVAQFSPGAFSQSGVSVPSLPQLTLAPSQGAGSGAGLAAGLGASADVYYGSEAPATASLLSHNGVGAYIQLINVLSSGAGDQKATDPLTNNLGAASAALKASYSQAVGTLPPALQAKDWGFSVANGQLVFIQGEQALTPQDFADLQKAFGGANVATSANQLATVLLSIDARQKAGGDPAALAWGRVQVDDNNFSDVVNLRSYVTDTAPGGKYTPPSPVETYRPEIPNILGGMDLRQLVSARPNFFKPNGSMILDTPEAEEAPPEVEQLGPIQGQCSCGEVRFSVENTFEYAFYCHCSRCRSRTGSVFAAIAGIAIDKVEVTAGHDSLLLEGECSDGYGARCSRCKSFLFAAVRGRKYMHVSLGVLQGTPSRLPDHHIYVGSKAPWFQITDGLPQYEELP
jgi:hypothetical protein